MKEVAEFGVVAEAFTESVDTDLAVREDDTREPEGKLERDGHTDRPGFAKVVGPESKASPKLLCPPSVCVPVCPPTSKIIPGPDRTRAQIGPDSESDQTRAQFGPWPKPGQGRAQFDLVPRPAPCRDR